MIMKFLQFIKRLFVNPDKKPTKKRDWIKWFARRHFIFNFIYTVILDLIVLLCIGFNFKQIALSIPLIILTLPLGVATVTNFVNLTRNGLGVALVNKHIEDILKQRSRVDFRKGPPGCGKSTQTLYEAKVLADKCWEELTYKYWLYKGIKEKELTPFQKQEKADVIEAYVFYQSEGTIPCLWSNVPVTDEQGRKANKLTKAHLLQQEKLPYLSVLFSDEIGSQFEATKGGNNKDLKPLSLLGRFIRHFFDGFWRLTEQDEKKSFIDIRRVVERVVLCISQVWVMKPTILLWIYNRLKKHYVKKTRKADKYKEGSKTYNKLQRKVYRTSKHHSKFMLKFKHYLDCVGYRKYTVDEREYNESDGTVLSSRTKSFYTPSCLNVKYNDRCFKNLYKAKDKKLKPSKFKQNFLTDEDVSQMYDEIKEKENNAN